MKEVENVNFPDSFISQDYFYECATANDDCK